MLDIGIEAIWEQVQHIAGLLRQKLSEVPGVTVQDKGRLLCGIVSFTLVRLADALTVHCYQTASTAPCLRSWSV